MFSIRSAAIAACGALLLGFAPTTTLACSCNGQYIITYGNDFERRVPSQPFEAHHDKGNLQTQNACRRDARDQAHACMKAIWRDRWEGGGLPGECTGNNPSGGARFRGAALPTNIKRSIERAACCQPSKLGDNWDSRVQVRARSSGGKGCGPNLQKSTTRDISGYNLDCMAVRDRENAAGRSCGRIVETHQQHYDRPGSDISRLQGSSSWQNCRTACRNNSNCRSWTWVPQDHEFRGCWLKDRIPWAKRVDLPGTAQMYSGTKEATQ